MSNIITEAMLVIIDFSKFGENLKMRLEFADFPKGQLISKGLVGILNSSKKRTKKFDLQYYDSTSSRLVFVRFLEELKTPKSPFEIN